MRSLIFGQKRMRTDRRICHTQTKNRIGKVQSICLAPVILSLLKGQSANCRIVRYLHQSGRTHLGYTNDVQRIQKLQTCLFQHLICPLPFHASTFLLFSIRFDTAIKVHASISCRYPGGLRHASWRCQLKMEFSIFLRENQGQRVKIGSLRSKVCLASLSHRQRQVYCILHGYRLSPAVQECHERKNVLACWARIAGCRALVTII
ncbi:hypothetical protein BKA64DRAFT_163255 [Cadophora sp. MPI-SDFR-AT-0126]|nr:hypothetical protein BKA64DRAFT_163255 [Leotiomycetes sp. MPI-SDFR-AT-0126]